MNQAVRILLAVAASAVFSNAAFAERCPIALGYWGALGKQRDEALPMLFTGRHPPASAGTCPDELCRAAFDLVCTSVAMWNVLHPNTMAYVTPAAAEADMNSNLRWIGTFPYAHPRRAPLYCVHLTRLAALTPDKSEPSRDKAIGYITELAVRLWPLDRTCPAKVKAAFPDTPTIRAIVAANNGLCLDRPAHCLPLLTPPVYLRPAQQRAMRPPGEVISPLSQHR